MLPNKSKLQSSGADLEWAFNYADPASFGTIILDINFYQSVYSWSTHSEYISRIIRQQRVFFLQAAPNVEKTAYDCCLNSV